ncbi:MAG: hypothetical protein V3V92_04860 [Candidatus Hydrothermarchaeales archaeon]
MIKAVFYIESQSNRKDVVKASLKNLIKKLKKEEKTKVRKEEVSDLLEENGMHSATTEVEVEFEDFKTYLMNSIKYGPSAIEVFEPKRLIISSKEFLEAVGEVIKLAKLFFEKYNVSFKFQKGKVEIGLTEEDIDGLLEQDAIRAKIVVEAKGKSRKSVLNSFVGAVSGDIFINKAKTKKMTDEKGFDGFVGVEAFTYEPRTLVDIAVKHTPVLIQILEPEEIELSMLDIQDIGVDLSSIFFEASHMLLMEPQG